MRTLTALVAGGHGLVLLPRFAAAAVPDTVAVPLAAPRLVHRTELLHAAGLAGAVGELVGRLSADR
ncbi:hypothetical protein [Streptomyces sp. NPDC003688]